MLIYAPHTGSRMKYIAEILLTNICGVDISFAKSSLEFESYQGPKINYSVQPTGPYEYWVSPQGLLSEYGIVLKPIDVFNWNGYKAFFRSKQGDFPFDVFSASFYLLSRYEEYLPHSKDEYGRFSHRHSLAFREGFLQQPLINYWMEGFKLELKRKFPDLLMRTSKFNFIPTYDIDMAYSYLYKGFVRNAGGLVKSLFKGRLSDMRDRIDVLMKKKDDPYDAYEWLYALHLKHNLHPYYFFLMAKEQRGYDKNISPTRDEMQELIRYHALGYQVGIHPSWQSGDDPSLLREEVELLEYITDRKITNSRQHFIRFTLPDSFRQIRKAGIMKEFSMGYGSINGFRASIAQPFLWYDLAKEEITDLEIYPFCFMDANAFYEQRQTPRAAFEELKYYHDTVKKVNGTLITIWHNNFFGTDPAYVGWREVYELFLREIVYWDI